jgi:hypothetical protein
MDQSIRLAVIRKHLCVFYEACLQQAKKKKHTRRINTQIALENKSSY